MRLPFFVVWTHPAPRIKKDNMKDFLFTLLAWLLTLPFLIGAITFAVYNGQEIPVIYNPFKDAATLPVYVPVLFAIGIGFIFGAIMTWAAMGRLRTQKREQARKIKILEKQLEDVKNPEPTRHNYAITPLKLLGRK